jgi:hypothetical protein
LALLIVAQGINNDQIKSMLDRLHHDPQHRHPAQGSSRATSTTTGSKTIVAMDSSAGGHSGKDADPTAANKLHGSVKSHDSSSGHGTGKQASELPGKASSSSTTKASASSSNSSKSSSSSHGESGSSGGSSTWKHGTKAGSHEASTQHQGKLLRA